MKPAETVLKFLESIGHGTEAQFYLDLFRSEARQSFAVIVVDPTTLQQTTDAVVVDLRFLTVLGLIPIVVVGSNQIETMHEHADHLKQKLGHARVSSATIDFTGDASPIIAAIAHETLPIVIINEGEQNAWYPRLGLLLSSLLTRKLIFLQSQRGFRLRGELLSVVNLSSEYETLQSSREFSDEQRQLLARSRQLLFELVPHKLLIAVTSPLNLLHELFTVKGAGTLLRKGVRIASYHDYDDVDTSKLRALLERSFGCPLNKDFFSLPISSAYIEEDYRGVALLHDTHLGGYLTKFAVTREAQGEGIGRDLWQFMTKVYSTIIWRARPFNPITPWYEQQCDGRVKTEHWTVYFKGLDTARISDAVQYALQQPVDF
jgi:hypothetical protein